MTALEKLCQLRDLRRDLRHTQSAILVAAREAAGLTQSALADKCGWSRQRQYEFESGRRGLSDAALRKVIAVLRRLKR